MSGEFRVSFHEDVRFRALHFERSRCNLTAAEEGTVGALPAVPVARQEEAMRRALLVIVALVSSAATALAQDKPVPFPEGYLRWTHVKTMIITPGHPLYETFGGMHFIYANPRAMEGYRKGKFDDGSIIVFDLVEAASKDDTISEGRRKLVAVMYKQSSQYEDTGGWGFESFKGSRRDRAVAGSAKAACFECHATQSRMDYVFSSPRR
jgi:hypothetical protein